MVWFEQNLYKDSQKRGQENSGNGYRTERFRIIFWKRYDEKYRTDNISVDYIGNENNKTITKRQHDKKTHACQGTKRNQVQHVSMEFTEW